MSRYRTFARGWRQAVPEAAGSVPEPTDPPTEPVLPAGDGPTLEHLWPADRPARVEDPTGHLGTTPEGALELRATPVDRTDLAGTLTRLRSGARPARSTTALAALLLAGIGFTGGVFAQKAMTPTGSTTTGTGTAAGGAGRGLGGAGGAGGFAGGAGANGVTVGTVQLVDGSTVYVQTAGGGVTIVHTGPHTTVHVTKTATVKDLVPGTTVVVQGTAAGDGAVQATTISQGGGLGRGTFGGSGGLGGSSTGRSGGGAASPSSSPSSP